MRIVDKAGRRLAPPLVPRLLAAPLACLLYGEATVIMTSIALAIPGDVVQRAASPAALALAVAAVSAALLWRTARHSSRAVASLSRNPAAPAASPPSA